MCAAGSVLAALFSLGKALQEEERGEGQWKKAVIAQGGALAVLLVQAESKHGQPAVGVREKQTSEKSPKEDLGNECFVPQASWDLVQRLAEK